MEEKSDRSIQNRNKLWWSLQMDIAVSADEEGGGVGGVDMDMSWPKGTLPMLLTRFHHDRHRPSPLPNMYNVYVRA